MQIAKWKKEHDPALASLVIIHYVSIIKGLTSAAIGSTSTK